MMSTNFGPLVGLKMNGGGKVDLTRRGLLGLKNKILAPTENLPAVTPKAPLSTVSEAKAPDVVAPLAQLAQKAAETPMTRREVLQRAGQTALSQAAKGIVPMAAKEVVKEAIQSAAPAIDEAAAANKIADYVAKVYGSSKAATKAFKQALGESPEEYLGWKPDAEDTHQLWHNLDEADPEAFADIAKSVGLDAETIAKKTGIPVDVVNKLSGGDGNILNDLIGASSIKAAHQSILEDGRPKEARRSTAYSDVFEDMDDAVKNALKDLGPDADEYDLIDHINQSLYDRFKQVERGEYMYDSKTGKYAPNENQERPVSKNIYNRVVDDETLDNIWEQASDDHVDLTEMMYDAMGRHGWKSPDD